jgi:hypothetical protein
MNKGSALSKTEQTSPA